MSYDLPFADRPTAVGCCQRGRTRLGVPRHDSVLRCAADGQSEDAVGVTITVAVVVECPTVARRPHKDRAETTTTLTNPPSSSQKNFMDRFFSPGPFRLILSLFMSFLSFWFRAVD